MKRITELLSGSLSSSRYLLDSEHNSAVTIQWHDRNHPRVGTAGCPEDQASANAWSSMTDVCVVTISADNELEGFAKMRRTFDSESPTAAHTVIVAKAHSTAKIFLDTTGTVSSSENLEIIVEDGATLTVVSVNRGETTQTHLASHFASIGKDAKLVHILVTIGGGITRVNPSFDLSKPGASVESYGMYFAEKDSHIEHQVYVNHSAEQTKSSVNYKGALNGKNARTVWIGDVLLSQNASGADSYEQNRNLILSEGARADSIPNLEIETGDIIGAGHASATTRFDEEQIFYLQSRGITEKEAKMLVVRAFMGDILHKIPDEELSSSLLKLVDHKLAGVTLS